MNELAQVGSGALAPADYSTYELAKQNDGILGGSDIAQIRSYAAYARAQAQAIHKTIAATSEIDDVAAIKAEATETAQTFAKVGIYADQRIGEILRELPKSNRWASNSHAGEFDKADALRDANVSKSEAYRLQTLADHPDVVEAVIAESEEKGEIVSRNKVLKAIKEQDQPKVHTCRECGMELKDGDFYASHKSICKKCYNKTNTYYYTKPFSEDTPEWSINLLISELMANAPTWRDTAMHTLGLYAECGVNVAQKSIDAITRAFDELDVAIAAIVEA